MHEHVDFPVEFSAVIFVDFKLAGAELHFTNIDNVVSPLDNHVDLCVVVGIVVTPDGNFTVYSVDSQCFFQALLMRETYFLKSESSPSVECWTAMVVLPESG